MDLWSPGIKNEMKNETLAKAAVVVNFHKCLVHSNSKWGQKVFYWQQLYKPDRYMAQCNLSYTSAQVTCTCWNSGSLGQFGTWVPYISHHVIVTEFRMQERGTPSE